MGIEDFFRFAAILGGLHLLACSAVFSLCRRDGGQVVLGPCGKARPGPLRRTVVHPRMQYPRTRGLPHHMFELIILDSMSSHHCEGFKRAIRGGVPGTPGASRWTSGRRWRRGCWRSHRRSSTAAAPGPCPAPTARDQANRP